jgi:hypothetical protein
MKGSRGPTVLVVVPDPMERRRYGGWLEGAGLEVMRCPGPPIADGCIGLREGSCQLAKGADVVVLDHRAGWEAELERYYLLQGKPIVVLGPRTEHFLSFGREWVIRLPWPFKRSGLENAVRFQADIGGPTGPLRAWKERLDAESVRRAFDDSGPGSG